MRLTRGESLTAASVVTCVALFVVGVGLVVPLTHPTRDRVDNSLLMVGVIGLLNAALLWKAKLLHDDKVVRAVIAVYAATSAVAVCLADFGTKSGVGWAVKGAAALALLLILRMLRPHRRG